VLAPGGYVVLVRDSDVAAFESMYPGVTIGGVYTGALNNGGEDIEVRDAESTVLVYVDYDDAPPWPTSADGLGYSLVIIDPAGDPNDPYNWRASTNSSGSPGASVPPPGIPAVVINEALTHTDLPAVDAIEIHNSTGSSADVRGWYLTDNRTVPKKALIPDEPQYNIAPGGYAIITEDDFGYDPGPGLPGFFLSSHGGEGVYIYSADVGGNITGYSQGFEFGASENGVSFGRHVSSDDKEHFVAQSSDTLGSANAGPKVGPLVISEIYYHPVEGEVEYIELTNISGATVNLWDDSVGGEPNNTYMVNGIGFAFDPGTTIGPGEILIVADTDSPKPTEPTYGPFGGGSVLDSAGEALTLLWPDTPDYSYVPYIVMDKVRYDDESPWPDADGNGMALRRIDNFAFGNDPANWEAVTPTHYPGGFPNVWVDFAFGGTELGTYGHPYNTLDEGLSVVSLGGTLRIKSGSSITSTSWTGRITDPVRIKAYPAGSVRIGELSGGSTGKATSSRASSTMADRQGAAAGAGDAADASDGEDVASVQGGAGSTVIVSRGPESAVGSVYEAEDDVIGIATEAADESGEPLEREGTAFVPVANLMGLATLVVAIACAGQVTILRRPRRFERS
jgi:hypothetical protein